MIKLNKHEESILNKNTNFRSIEHLSSKLQSEKFMYCIILCLPNFCIVFRMSRVQIVEHGSVV